MSRQQRSRGVVPRRDPRGRSPQPKERRRDRRPLLIVLAALIPAALLLLLGLGALGGGSSGRTALDPTSPPEALVTPEPSPAGSSAGTAASASPLTSASPSAAAIPTPTPTPRVAVGPVVVTPPPTPKPTPRPTKAPATTASATSPARAVTSFYNAVEHHRWNTAIALWSPSMQQRYPPDEWLIGRFRRTTRIDIPRLSTISVNRAAGTARVAVTIVEYRTVEPSPRTFSGSWDLVLIDGRWLLDAPHF